MRIYVGLVLFSFALVISHKVEQTYSYRLLWLLVFGSKFFSKYMIKAKAASEAAALFSKCCKMHTNNVCLSKVYLVQANTVALIPTLVKFKTYLNVCID